MGFNMKKPDWMPRRVSAHGRNWTYRPSDSNRRIIICSLDASKHDFLKAYNSVLQNLKAGERQDMQAMIEGYLASQLFKKLASSSQKDYLLMANRWKKLLKQFMPEQVKPKTIVVIHEQLTSKRGAISADRHLSVLSRIFTWGRQRGWVEIDPTKQLYIKNGTNVRDRYITDEEFMLVREHANDMLKSIMDVSYLCAARLGDVIELTHDQLLEEGIYIQQGKTGVKQIKEWSTALRDAILRVRGQTQSMKFVFHKPNGDKWAKRTIQAWYTKAKSAASEQAKEESIQFEPDFTFHDIKAKAISDFEGDKKLFSGHKTSRMVSVYDRKTKTVKTIHQLPKSSKP